MSSFIDKSLILNEIKKHVGYKKNADFASFLGIKPQTLSSWYSRNAFDIELLYAKCGDINPHWLLTGKGSMLKSKSEFAPPPIEPAPPGPAVESTQVIAYLERKITEKETELKEAYYEIGRLNALVEQLKKDTNKGNYAPGTKELKQKQEK